MLYNFYISWGKRQEELEQKLEVLNKEHLNIINNFAVLSKKIDIALKTLEEVRREQNKICKNSDYIKEGTLNIQEKKNYSLEGNTSNIIQQITEIKQTVAEVKTLILS